MRKGEVVRRGDNSDEKNKAVDAAKSQNQPIYRHGFRRAESSQSDQPVSVRRLETNALRELLKQAHALDSGSEEDDYDTSDDDDNRSSRFGSSCDHDAISLSTIEEEPDVLSPSWQSAKALSSRKRGNSFFSVTPKTRSPDVRSLDMAKVLINRGSPSTLSTDVATSVVSRHHTRDYRTDTVSGTRTRSASGETFVFTPSETPVLAHVSQPRGTPNSSGHRSNDVTPTSIKGTLDASPSSTTNNTERNNRNLSETMFLEDPPDFAAIAALLRQAATMSLSISEDLPEALKAAAEALESKKNGDFRLATETCTAEITRLGNKLKLLDTSEHKVAAEYRAREKSEDEEKRLAQKRKSAIKALQLLGDEAPVLTMLNEPYPPNYSADIRPSRTSSLPPDNFMAKNNSGSHARSDSDPIITTFKSKNRQSAFMKVFSSSLRKKSPRSLKKDHSHRKKSET